MGAVEVQNTGSVQSLSRDSGKERTEGACPPTGWCAAVRLQQVVCCPDITDAVVDHRRTATEQFGSSIHIQTVQEEPERPFCRIRVGIARILKQSVFCIEVSGLELPLDGSRDQEFLGDVAE
ncbi:hypothetical protein SDC9_142410 [bioreactor metagenome]|uniref:Uncharacterized protein n=1 Tax=bioreactor metagenome TaxID=1076179 RepID=A0A645E125_9ZZZZ